jgi:hypothetical protein
MISQVEFGACIAINMIQNITSTRENKRLTLKDLSNITRTSSLNFFPGISMFSPFPLGVRPYTWYYYIKRENGTNYLWAWRARPDNGGLGTSYECVEYNKNSSVNASNINPKLVCNNNGDEKVLVRYFYTAMDISDYMAKLAFRFLKPKVPSSWYCDTISFNTWKGNNNVFTCDLTFTPKPGLFPLQGYE